MKRFYTLLLMSTFAFSCAEEAKKNPVNNATNASQATGCNAVYVKKYESLHLVDQATSTETLKKVIKGSKAVHKQDILVQLNSNQKLYRVSNVGFPNQELPNEVAFELDEKELKVSNEKGIVEKIELTHRYTNQEDYRVALTDAEKKSKYESEVKSPQMITSETCGMKNVEVYYYVDQAKNTLKTLTAISINIKVDTSKTEQALKDGEITEIKPGTLPTERDAPVTTPVNPTLPPITPNPPSPFQPGDALEIELGAYDVYEIDQNSHGEIHGGPIGIFSVQNTRMDPKKVTLFLSFENEHLTANSTADSTKAKLPSKELKLENLNRASLSWISNAFAAELVSSNCTQVGGLIVLNIEQVDVNNKKTGEFKELCIALARSRP